MTELGKAYVQIVPSAQGISGAISGVILPEADKAGEAAGSSLGGRLVSVAKAVIAAAGIGKALVASVMQGAALEQSIGGIETLFKGSADTIKNYAKDAYKNAGISANEYMEQATSFSASLISSLGGDTAKAADLANTALVDMSDNANKMGTNMVDIQNAYQGFAKQNYTMLDNLKLGYGGTKQEMERLLADATKLTGVKYDISNFSDVISAIHVVQENLDITGTTAKEAATTVSGSFGMMKASFKDLLGNLAQGKDIDRAMENLVKSTGTFLFKNLIPMLGRIFKSIPQAIRAGLAAAGPEIKAELSNVFGEGVANTIVKVATVIGPLIPIITKTAMAFLLFKLSTKAILGTTGALIGLPDKVLKVAESIETLATTTTKLPKTLSKLSKMPSELMTALELLKGSIGQVITNAGKLPIIGPIIQKVSKMVVGAFNLIAAHPVVAAILAIIAVFVLLYTKCEWFRNGVNEIFSSLGEFMTGVWESITTTLTQAWESLVLTAQTIFEPFKEIFTTMWDGIVETFTATWEGFKEAATMIWDGLVSIAQGAFEMLKAVIVGPILIVCDILTGNWQQLGADLEVIWNAISSAAGSIWNGIKSVVSGLVKGLVTDLSARWNLFKAMFTAILESVTVIASGAWNSIKDTVVNTCNSIVEGAQRAWEDLTSSVSDTVERVKGFFGRLSEIDLFEAGAAIMEGFLNGLKSLWSDITNFIGDIAEWIREHKGPLSYDRKLLIPAGKAIMEGLDEGLHERFQGVKTTVSNMGEELSKSFDVVDLNSAIDDKVKPSVSVQNLRESGLSGDLVVDNQRDQSDQVLAQLIAISDYIKQISEKDPNVYIDGEVAGATIGPHIQKTKERWDKYNSRREGVFI